MLVEHTKPQSRTIGELHVLPGMNQVSDELWDKLSKSGKWAKPIKGLITDGVLIVLDPRKKLTVALVEKTYNVALLNEWSETAKGPLLGAIRKQIDVMESRPEGAEDDMKGL